MAGASFIHFDTVIGTGALGVKSPIGTSTPESFVLMLDSQYRTLRLLGRRDMNNTQLKLIISIPAITDTSVQCITACFPLRHLVRRHIFTTRCVYSQFHGCIIYAL